MTIKQTGGIFGRNPAFNDVDASSLDVSGQTTTDTLQANTSINVDGTITADAGSVFDAGGNFVADSDAANKSIVLASSGATGGTNQLGASVAFSRINTTSPRAAIAAINTDGNFERMGLAFYTHRSNNSADPMVRSMMIKHDGHVFIDDTNLVFSTAGNGIDFSSTSDGSGTTTSELFDDYEEGTWTPALEFTTSGSVTYNQQNGYYTKVGNIVHVQAWIYGSTLSSPTGNIRIIGMPFSADVTDTPRYSTTIPTNNVTGGTGITGIVYGWQLNATRLQLSITNDGDTTSNLTGDKLNTNFEFYVNYSYRAS